VTWRSLERRSIFGGYFLPQAETTAGTPPISRTLAVVKIGTTRYVVLDRDHRVGEYEVIDIFDSKWKFLVGIVS